MRVQVYRNLNRDCWSVLGKSTRRVIHHAQAVALRDVRFTVGERSRQRAIRRKRRNVNAWVEGYLVALDADVCRPAEPMLCVTYRPFEAGHFFRVSDREPVAAAPWAVLENRKVFVPAASP